MRDGDRERDDAEPVGGVGTTPDEPDRDAAEDADASARITNEATEAFMDIMDTYSLVHDTQLRGELLRHFREARRMTETEARAYVTSHRFATLRDRYVEAARRERAPLGRVVGADETESADASGLTTDVSRDDEAREALRAYRALPTLHSYLGEVGDVRGGAAAHADLERLANGDVAGSGTGTGTLRSRAVRVPVLAMYDHVLFPGDTLPLFVDGRTDPDRAEMVALANAAPPPLTGFFGVVCIAGWLESDNESDDAARSLRPTRPMVGTLAQIRRVAGADANGAGARENGSTRLVARGRARFAVKDPWSLIGPQVSPHGVHLNVEVELLSDAAERPKLRRVFGDAPSRARGAGRRTRAPPRLGLTPHSAATYALFDPHALARRLRASPALAVALGCRAPSDGSPNDENKRALETELPLDPSALSHRVASRAPVSLATRYALLCADTVVDRLRLELKLFGVFSDFSRFFTKKKDGEKDDETKKQKRERRESICLSCSSCSAPLSALASLVAMSDEGAGGAYCNPAGLVHDVLTVGEVFPNAVALEGEPSAEFSWFPGFAWTVAVCVRCRQHLGWQFTPEAPTSSATTTRTGSGVPRSRFFGLTRARVRADGFESLESLCDIADTPYAQQVRSLEAADEWDA